MNALLFLAGLPFVPEYLRERWIIGLPGWRFCIGRDCWRNSGYVISWAWRKRASPIDGEMAFHFYFQIIFGRSRFSVIDFGGPWWCPWPIWGYDHEITVDWIIDTRRWTGRPWDFICIDWPHLSFNFTRITE